MLEGHRPKAKVSKSIAQVSVDTFAVSKKLVDLSKHADTLCTSLSAWKITTDCLVNLSTSATLLTKAITIDFVICIGLE